jgi:hypothetical protein
MVAPAATVVEHFGFQDFGFYGRFHIRLFCHNITSPGMIFALFSVLSSNILDNTGPCQTLNCLPRIRTGFFQGNIVTFKETCRDFIDAAFAIAQFPNKGGCFVQYMRRLPVIFDDHDIIANAPPDDVFGLFDSTRYHFRSL